jgi:hypothetical protein
MLLANGGGLGLLSHVHLGLFPVLVPKGGEEVAFAVLSAVDERNGMVKVPLVPWKYLAP